MASQLYQDLREQLDQYSVGFPETESGVEVQILERLFDEDEARTYLEMSIMAEPADSLAARTGHDVEPLTERLERMVAKGLIFRVEKDGVFKYGASAFMVGSYEYQVKDMDREFAELFEQYFLEAFSKVAGTATPVLRTIPVNQAIDVAWPVAPYEDARQIVQSKGKIAVTQCICRVQQGLLEKACDKPLEVCLAFGSHGQYYVDKGMGRWITTEEALAILDQCDEAGLVPQPFNAQNPGGLCNCCGDCCGVLRALKMQSKPAERVLSNFFAAVDAGECTECGTCEQRCPMDAITTADAAATVDRDRCIGCGLCVTTCPAGRDSRAQGAGGAAHAPPQRPGDDDAAGRPAGHVPHPAGGHAEGLTGSPAQSGAGGSRLVVEIWQVPSSPSQPH